MQTLKHYFDKTDTPYDLEWQKHKKYHVAWKHYAYSRLFGHEPVKIKWLGIFTVYRKGDK